MKQIIALIVSGFLAYASLSSLFPVIPSYAVSIGASQSVSGLIAGAFAIVTAILMIPFGFLSRRIGERKLVLAGLAMYVVSPLLYGVASSPAHLLIYRLLNGLGVSMFIPSINAAASKLAESGKRGEMFGVLTTSYMLGFVFGPIAGSFAYETGGFGRAFHLSSILALLAIFPAVKIEGGGGAAEKLSVSRRTVASSIIVFSSTFGLAALALFALPLHYVRFGLSETAAGITISILFLFSALSRTPAGYLADRLGMMRVALLGIALEVIGLVSVSLSTGFYAVVALSATCGAGSGVANTASFALASSDRNAGVAMGFVNSFLNLGIFAGPLVCGYISEFLPVNEAMIAVTILAFLSSLPSFRLGFRE